MKDILDDDFFDRPIAIKRTDKYIELLLQGKDKIRFYTPFMMPSYGDYAEINGKIAPDGVYKIHNESTKYAIKNGILVHEFYIEAFKLKNEDILEIDASRIYGIGKNNRVHLNGKLAPDGRYRLNWWKTITVLDGVTV